MKKTLTAVISGLITIISLQTAYTQIPSYELCVRNITHITINYPDDAIVFDIYLRNTNQLITLEYAGGQFYHNFNKDIFNPPPTYPPPSNDTTYISYMLLASDLPPEMLLRNPSFGMADVPILRTSSNVFPGAGGGYIISTSYPGTLLARMRIWNKQASMNSVPLNLQWRNAPSIPSTKIFVYIGTTNTDITNPNSHCIITDINNTQNEIPAEFKLHQNYPNPFNPVTKISYELRVTSYVTLKVFDISGKEVVTLVNQKQDAGNYSVEWDAGGHASGVYMCRLEAEGYNDTKRMLLIK